jgi:hypothetical protein
VGPTPKEERIEDGDEDEEEEGGGREEAPTPRLARGVTPPRIDVVVVPLRLLLLLLLLLPSFVAGAIKESVGDAEEEEEEEGDLLISLAFCSTALRFSFKSASLDRVTRGAPTVPASAVVSALALASPSPCFSARVEDDEEPRAAEEAEEMEPPLDDTSRTICASRTKIPWAGAQSK